jgi:hypothetical protein
MSSIYQRKAGQQDEARVSARRKLVLERLEQRILLDTSFGPEQVIDATADSARSVRTADIDGDGNQGVLSASAGNTTIAWYENQGRGNFGGPQVIADDVEPIARQVTRGPSL